MKKGIYLLLFLLLCSSSFAQEHLTGDAHLQAVKNAQPAFQNSAVLSRTAKTAVISLPLFDDFTGSGWLPDTSKWDYLLSGSRIPRRSLSKGLHPPSIGVLNFDGADTSWIPYNTQIIENGEADFIYTKPFDFTLRTPGDSIYLSFFYQAGGRGDKPESGDSLVVSLQDTAGNYIRVWEISGDSAATDTFSLAMIPVRDSAFFHDNFRIRIHTTGSLNGINDQWHIDYLYFNAGRNWADTLFNDIAVVFPTKPVMHPFTAVPIKQYDATQYFMKENPVNELHLLSNTSQSTGLRMDLDEPTGSNPFAGITTLTHSGIVLDTAIVQDTMPSIFTNQAISNYASMRVTTYLQSPTINSRTTNDTMVHSYPIDSIWAYDDGEWDAGYGVGAANRGFGQKYHLLVPDTVLAVWIAFVPTINYNAAGGQTTYLENKSFMLTIWDEFHPDSFVVQQVAGMTVQYGTADEPFVKYDLFNKTGLSDTMYWFGLVQVDNMPIGVGYDLNYNNNDLVIFENSQGAFQQSGLNGTLMIRPQFENADFIISREDEWYSDRHALQVYPNPAQDEVNLSLDEIASAKKMKITVLDVQGKVVLEDAQADVTFPAKLNTETLAGGIYFVKLYAEAGGKILQRTVKITISR